MHTTFALAALAAVAYARPQGVTENISPETSAPQGCSPSHSGSFQIQAVNVTTSSSNAKRQNSCGSEGVLTVDLADGVLTDSQGRTGYIAANYQFQFDKPAQTGAIYTAGWSSCGNGSLALGGSAVFYQCYSGGFYNLYDRHWAAQCNPIYLDILPCSGSSTGSTTGAASQIGDGQPQVSTAASAPISQISDGQPQATSAVAPITQIGDGQIQAPTSIPPVALPSPISQISDGQIQVPTTVATPISQISDGQVQVPTAVAPAPTGGIVSQIPDGQIQTNATSSPLPYTGAASSVAGSQVAALIVAVAAAAFL
ncbi:hypothetical protein GLAREA_10676 [Glarea lozoyensis ATCC 20868]|uniref:Cell wall mannoprotein PIR1-like C-terminal domain-containing protein n=1 Tax=Glarea lozoyensis (strain ATCC 20868 / MF5171) TaxID=1116229 RepID=S3DSN3_GLAL2|nr:uncharacterized protein GLAREA_10676 [Glarea lozoyensis ATCC 20868]EPE34981.1 hypothetical protein GLAREA_10676 [Glarea lozoyensis ATCC 20868]